MLTKDEGLTLEIKRSIFGSKRIPDSVSNTESGIELASVLTALLVNSSSPRLLASPSPCLAP